jgi:hypothetical protein
MALREVQSLRKLRHPNIVKLKEVVREHDVLHMVGLEETSGLCSCKNGEDPN